MLIVGSDSERGKKKDCRGVTAGVLQRHMRQGMRQIRPQMLRRRDGPPGGTEQVHAGDEYGGVQRDGGQPGAREHTRAPAIVSVLDPGSDEEEDSEVKSRYPLGGPI